MRLFGGALRVKIHFRAPLKTRDFDGRVVISTAQMLNNILIYFRKTKNKKVLSGRKKRRFLEVFFSSAYDACGTVWCSLMQLPWGVDKPRLTRSRISA
jgi:hypothetical protein